MPELTRPVAGGDVEASWGADVTDRVVSRYATTAARDAAAPHDEGMVCYIASDDEFQTFDGTVWTASLDVTTAAATYQTQAQADALYLALAGGTMGGPINMQTNKLSRVDDIEFDSPSTFVHQTIGGAVVFRSGSTNKFEMAAESAGNAIQAAVGSEAEPAYAFTADPDLGMYRSSAGSLGLAAAGQRILSVSNTRIFSEREVRVNFGSLSDPQYTFEGDTNTGIYKFNPTGVGITVDGVHNFRVAANAMYNPVHPTTTASASAFLESGSGLFYRVTSMGEAKANLTNLSAKSAKEMIAGLEPKRFSSKLQGDKDQAADSANPSINRFVGFVAEEVWGAIPEAAQDHNYDHRAILAALVKVVQGMM